MAQITMFDVGDKQHLLYVNQNTATIIDIGGNVVDKLPHYPMYYDADVLVLSHFHKDHYDALIDYAFNRTPRVLHNIKQLFLPIIVSNEHYVQDLFIKMIAQQMLLQYYKRPQTLVNIPIDAFIMLLVGSLTHEAQLTIRALHQGQTFSMANQQYDVLWPSIDVIHAYRESIEETLQEFDEVYGRDENMQIAIRTIREHSNLLWTEGVQRIEINRNLGQGILADARHRPEGEWYRTVNQHFTTAQTKLNTKLAHIANHLCLAFRNDDWLFFGDLESNDLGNVMTYLGNQHWLNRYKLIVAAHHGTHSNPSQQILRTDFCIASQGHGLYNTQREQKARYIYTHMAPPHMVTLYETTWKVGDITKTI